MAATAKKQTSNGNGSIRWGMGVAAGVVVLVVGSLLGTTLARVSKLEELTAVQAVDIATLEATIDTFGPRLARIEDKLDRLPGIEDKLDRLLEK